MSSLGQAPGGQDTDAVTCTHISWTICKDSKAQTVYTAGALHVLAHRFSLTRSLMQTHICEATLVDRWSQLCEAINKNSDKASSLCFKLETAWGLRAGDNHWSLTLSNHFLPEHEEVVGGQTGGDKHIQTNKDWAKGKKWRREIKGRIKGGEAWRQISNSVGAIHRLVRQRRA